MLVLPGLRYQMCNGRAPYCIYYISIGTMCMFVNNPTFGMLCITVMQSFDNHANRHGEREKGRDQVNTPIAIHC